MSIESAIEARQAAEACIELLQMTAADLDDEQQNRFWELVHAKRGNVVKIGETTTNLISGGGYHERTDYSAANRSSGTTKATAAQFIPRRLLFDRDDMCRGLHGLVHIDRIPSPEGLPADAGRVPAGTEHIEVIAERAAEWSYLGSLNNLPRSA